MAAMRTTALLVAAALLLIAGCASTQKITVITDPPGAHVTLTKYGVAEAKGGVPGVVVESEGGSFEDDPVGLGTSPLEYEFRLKEDQEHFSAPGIFLKVVKKITAGLIRAEKDGSYAERRVDFSGKPLVIDLRLEAGTPPEPSPEPEP
jgi:hypothetical protein